MVAALLLAIEDAVAPEHTRLWAMVETPTAIFDVRAIAAHPRVAVLVMGTNDLAKEILAPLVPGAAWTFATLGLELVPVRVDRLSLLFGLLFHIAALIGAIYALRAKDRLEHSAAFAYAGGALGAVFAGDLVTLFVYWEIMAVASVPGTSCNGRSRTSFSALDVRRSITPLSRGATPAAW